MDNLKNWKGYIEQFYKKDDLVDLTQELIRRPSHVNHPGREREKWDYFLENIAKEWGLM